MEKKQSKVRNTSRKEATRLKGLGTLHFQLGLILSMLFVYGALEWVVAPSQPGLYDPLPAQSEFAYVFSEQAPAEQKEIKPAEQPRPKASSKIVVSERIPLKPASLARPDITAPALSVGNASGTTIDNKNTRAVFSLHSVQELPVFPGCEGVAQEEQRACFNRMMRRHVQRYFRYPDQAVELQQEGRVYVEFIIDETGQANHFRLRGPSVLLEQEAGRILGKLPRMQPGKIRGLPVAVRYSMPISFQLE
ncbi:energy transducer TonB [Robiginitalea sp. IMCC44478]|uniref:energy transducer TonB n=1 Tax=Robiginitalea sp. IMCC44478 TaxID=3459122 RepID=UPI0040430C91